VQCRAANSAYAHRSPVGTVDAAPARAYLVQLAQIGLGSAQVAALAHVSRLTVRRVRRGTLTRLRPSTAAALLAVRPVLAAGAIVPGTRTHRFLDSLRREGFTRRSIAFQLGARSQQLQLHSRVRVASALRVAAFYNLVAAEDPA
jgi:hypothetical protein